MPEWIADDAIAVAPELVGERHDDLGPGRRCLLVETVDILGPEMNRHRRALERLGRMRAHVRELVVQIEARIAELHLGMQELAVRHGTAANFLGAKGLLVKLQRLRPAAHDQVRRHAVAALGDASCRSGHGALLPS